MNILVILVTYWNSVGNVCYTSELVGGLLDFVSLITTINLLSNAPALYPPFFEDHLVHSDIFYQRVIHYFLS